jgi:hypothetical protein
VANEGKVFTDRRSVGVADSDNPNGSVHFHPLCGEKHDRRLPCVHPPAAGDICHCGAPFDWHPVSGGWACEAYRRAIRVGRA